MASIGQQAAEYARAGWPLVLLPPRSKGDHGMRAGWNKRENAVTDPAIVECHGGNVGVLLAFAGLLAVDIDDLPAARVWFAQHSIDLDAWLNAPDAVRIDSGRPGRAKLLYRLHDNINPLEFITHKIQSTERKVILELRCAGRGGVSMQDVLPPSVHPVTGEPYQWHGDWHRVPYAPLLLLQLWSYTGPIPKAQRAPDTPPLGPGLGSDFRAMVDALEAHGCRPYLTGHGARAFCPCHGGESGTTLKVDEAADGRVLVHCFAGCSFADVLEALGLASPEVRMNAKASRNAPEADPEPAAMLALPPVPPSLCALPGRLGEVQGWIAATMYKPHAAVAGLAAIGLVHFMAMERTRVLSRGGLAMGEFFLVLAPSAFGKEALRTPFRKLAEFCARERLALPDLHYSAPSSQQGLQEMLMASRAVGMLPDEFGDWIAKGDKDAHREQAMAHLMQVYGNPFGTVDVPRAITRKLVPVKEPRLLLFATSTGERFAEVVNGSIADRGFLNRFVVLPVGDDRLEIADANDDPALYEIPPALASLAMTICPGEKVVSFEPDVIAFRAHHLRTVLDPLATRDNRLAGRLNEQATRMAAAFALADGRCVIDGRDMAMAYEIREALYARTAAMFEADATLSADTTQGRALEQVRMVLKKHASLKRSRLRDLSRQYRRLTYREQDDLLRLLVNEGLARIEDGRLTSLIYRDDKDDAGTT